MRVINQEKEPNIPIEEKKAEASHFLKGKLIN